ncbi:hypothetical protein D3OALGA1CA_2888 [Olavius algarvensis associated proteobacterium Delta 3]|nr:hypothetical protein D3OALGA1CA_2888 [Olavius algarvensis associated proteobacterium Delta 3]
MESRITLLGSPAFSHYMDLWHRPGETRGFPSLSYGRFGFIIGFVTCNLFRICKNYAKNTLFKNYL